MELDYNEECPDSKCVELWIEVIKDAKAVWWETLVLVREIFHGKDFDTGLSLLAQRIKDPSLKSLNKWTASRVVELCNQFSDYRITWKYGLGDWRKVRKIPEVSEKSWIKIEKTKKGVDSFTDL